MGPTFGAYASKWLPTYQDRLATSAPGDVESVGQSTVIELAWGAANLFGFGSRSMDPFQNDSGPVGPARPKMVEARLSENSGQVLGAEDDPFVLAPGVAKLLSESKIVDPICELPMAADQGANTFVESNDLPADFSPMAPFQAWADDHRWGVDSHEGWQI